MILRTSRLALISLAVTFMGIACSNGSPDSAPPSVSENGEHIGSVQQALVKSFPAGSLVIPMDTTFQDNGTLKAFGLVYKLATNNVPVHWTADSGKTSNTGVDFVATGKDFVTQAVVTNHGYRGAPFVIDASNRAAALPIIQAWQAANTTTVHDMTAAFNADDRRVLVAAPRIGVFLDGSENIAFEYLNAAGIPDSTGAVWTKQSPDLLTEAQVAGAAGGAFDGALRNSDGTPKYCQLTSMHYNAPGNAEAIREVRGWLSSSSNTHAFMECAATQTFENSPNGHFLTTNGITNKGPSVNPTHVLHPENLFSQYDGAFTGVGGSVSIINLAANSSFYSSDVTLINQQGAAATQNLAWLTGNVDGDVNKGKVSYLVGHNYQSALPISGHPATNGIRLFLDSLFQTDCASAASQPTITLTKSAPASISGSSLTFTITYGNSGPGIANAVKIVDPVPAGTTFVSATGGGALAAGNVTWTLGNLAVNETGSVSFTVNVPADGTITNQAHLDYTVGVTPKTFSSNQTSTTKAPLVSSSDLSVSVIESPNPVAPGGTMTYAVTVGNAGPDVSGAVTVTDSIPAGTSFVSGVGTGWTCVSAAGVVTCTHAGIAAGGTAPLTLTMTAPINAGTVSNTVSVSSATSDPAPANNSVTTVTTVQPSSDLSVTMTDAPDPVAAGGALTYTVTAHNAGPSTSAAITFSDTLPAGVVFGSATGAGWTCGAVGQVVTCTHAALSSNATVTLTLDVTAPNTPGVLSNTGTISSATSDPAPANNSVTATTTVGAASSDVSVTMTDAPDPVVSGGLITYTVGVNNAGPSPSGALTVTDVVPVGTTFQGASGAGWTCNLALGTVTCTHGALASGANAPLSIDIAAPAVAGTVTNTVVVAGAAADPAPANNTVTTTTTVSPPPGADLSVTMTSGPDPVGIGGNEAYSVTVSNAGPALSGPITVTDVLPAGATFASGTGAGWTCTLVASTVTCTHAALASGGSAPLTINITAPAIAGTMTNTVAVASTSPDPGAANNVATTTVTVTGGAAGDANLAIGGTGSPSPVAGGANETYQFTVTNNGPNTSGVVTVTDTLPVGATFQSAGGTGWNCTPGATTVVCTHGALPNGQTGTLTIVVMAPLASGTMTNSATVTSTTTDPDDADNTITTVTTINGASLDGGVDSGDGGGGSDLSISVSASPNPVAPGGTETYTVTATNSGPDPSGTVTVTDVLPAGATFVSGIGVGWNCVESAGTVTCTHNPLASGESTQVVITIQVPNSAGTISNTTSVSSTTSDPNGANNGVVTVTTVGSIVGDGGACAVDSDCGAINGGIVCDTNSNSCVLGCRGAGGNGCPANQTCTSVDNTIGQCVANDGGGTCSVDSDCGGTTSGLVCDVNTATCVPGCRGSGGNSCPVDQSCTSVDNSIGQCVALTDGGTDAGTDAATDAGDAGDGGNDAGKDGGQADSGSDAALSDSGTGRDASGDDGGPSVLNPTPDTGSIEGGGCSCTTANGETDFGSVSLAALTGLGLFVTRRRRRSA